MSLEMTPAAMTARLFLRVTRQVFRNCGSRQPRHEPIHLVGGHLQRGGQPHRGIVGVLRELDRVSSELGFAMTAAYGTRRFNSSNQLTTT